MISASALVFTCPHKLARTSDNTISNKNASSRTSSSGIQGTFGFHSMEYTQWNILNANQCNANQWNSLDSSESLSLSLSLMLFFSIRIAFHSISFSFAFHFNCISIAFHFNCIAFQLPFISISNAFQLHFNSISNAFHSIAFALPLGCHTS